MKSTEISTEQLQEVASLMLSIRDKVLKAENKLEKFNAEGKTFIPVEVEQQVITVNLVHKSKRKEGTDSKLNISFKDVYSDFFKEYRTFSKAVITIIISPNTKVREKCRLALVYAFDSIQGSTISCLVTPGPEHNWVMEKFHVSNKDLKVAIAQANRNVDTILEPLSMYSVEDITGCITFVKDVVDKGYKIKDIRRLAYESYSRDLVNEIILDTIAEHSVED